MAETVKCKCDSHGGCLGDLLAMSVRNGYSATIRTSLKEQEFVKDPDGPWVLNSDVAQYIRAAKSSIVAAASDHLRDATKKVCQGEDGEGREKRDG